MCTSIRVNITSEWPVRRWETNTEGGGKIYDHGGGKGGGATRIRDSLADDDDSDGTTTTTRTMVFVAFHRRVGEYVRTEQDNGDDSRMLCDEFFTTVALMSHTIGWTTVNVTGN